MYTFPFLPLPLFALLYLSSLCAAPLLESPSEHDFPDRAPFPRGMQSICFLALRSESPVFLTDDIWLAEVQSGYWLIISIPL